MSEYIHLRGRKLLLENKERLTALGRRLSIRDAGAQAEALLVGSSILTKIPHLILPSNPANGDFAVLLREYSVAGVPSGIFVPFDHAGELTVLAAKEERLRVGSEVLAYLLNRQALAILLSLHDVDLATQPPDGSLARYAVQTRRIRRSVALQATLDATLAVFGTRTRRNLRYYARLATNDLGAVFHSNSDMSEQNFLDLNKNGSYPFTERVARWLYRSSKEPKRFLVAVSIEGRGYVSALGGRHFEDQAIVDWQINRKGLPKHSIGTAMRYFYIRHEVERGTKVLSFEGGTPHSMQHSFFEEPVTDVLAVRRPLSPQLVRQAIAAIIPRGNFISHILLEGKANWR